MHLLHPHKRRIFSVLDDLGGSGRFSIRRPYFHQENRLQRADNAVRQNRLPRRLYKQKKQKLETGEGDIGLEAICIASGIRQIETICSGHGKIGLEQIDELDARLRRHAQTANVERQARLRGSGNFLSVVSFLRRADSRQRPCCADPS